MHVDRVCGRLSGIVINNGGDEWQGVDRRAIGWLDFAVAGEVDGEVGFPAVRICLSLVAAMIEPKLG